METCQWCRAAAKNEAAVAEFLKSYCTNGLTQEEIKEANNDFVYCLECVVEYHRARERVPALHKRLWVLETARLLEVFRETLEVDLDDCDLFLVDNGLQKPIPTYSPEEFHNRLKFPLMEVLKYPYLLCHKELCEMVVKVLCKMEDMNKPLLVEDQCQGTYLLMVHPNETVRRWALNTAKLLGRVDRDGYYDLQEVFICMFYVIELGITGDFMIMDDSYCSGKLQMLPPHLYDSKNKKSYWLGICMLLMQLDSQAMDSLLMGPAGQSSIPQCIINTMSDVNKDDAGSDPFWPALQCFLVILDRLGSNIWGQIEPLDAFRAITKADSYRNEIDDIRQKTSGVKVEPENHNDLLSCSQIVYDCYTTERRSRTSYCSSSKSDTSGTAIFEEMSSLVNVLQSEMGKGMRVYGSTFLWFIPFVHSIMEATVLNSICIGEVFHYLDNNINKDMLYGRTHTCDKVTEFFIRILINIIDLQLNKGCMETMSYFTHIWLDIVLQCATLFGNCNIRIQEVDVCRMRQASLGLIRSLLKEWERTGTDPETQDFLNQINKHLRGGSVGGWNLSKSYRETLKKCLLKAVKTISERPALPNDVPCAPPTPPSETTENEVSYPYCSVTPPLPPPQVRNAMVGTSDCLSAINYIKDEPLQDYGENQSFCDGRKEIKQEPSASTAFKPTLNVNCFKPDMGKMKEIMSKLKDEQNLSRIHAIAKGKAESLDEQGKCSGLKDFGIESGACLQPSPSLAKTPEETRLSTSKRKVDEEDDDEPLNVRRHGLKRLFSSTEKDSMNSKQVSVPLSSSAKEICKRGKITIFGVPSNDKNPLECKDTHAPPSLDLDLKSPCRDYDDLSESQVFEFETQENVVSAWNEPHITTDNKKLKLGTDSKEYTPHNAVDLLATQPVSNQDIEEACLQVEALISKQLQEPVASKMQMQQKTNLTEKCVFIAPKPLTHPRKTGLTNQKDDKSLNRKSLFIEALNKKIKFRKPCNTIFQNPVKPCSSTMLPPSSVRSSTTAPSKGSTASSITPSRQTPAIVPPKKVRKHVEPESKAELLGLKKKERKAFELSQRSLDCLGELRSYGQNVHVEPQQKSKRVRQQKVVTKKGKKLLASQEMQFIRQSRERCQKSTPVSAKSKKYPIPSVLPKSKPPTETVKESEEEEKDDYFLPCSQPDPDRKMDSKMGASFSTDSKRAENIENIDEFSFLQSNKEASGSMAEGEEPRGGGGDDDDDDDDDEWTCLTQNEPTDMELCSQMEDTYGENFIIGCVQEDDDPNNQSNVSEGATTVQSMPKPLSDGIPQKSPLDVSNETSSNSHLFLKPSIPVECQKAKPSTTKIYTVTSRNASLAKEMGKSANHVPAANAAKAKVARPPPAMPLPPPFSKPTSKYEVCQPLLPKPIPYSSNPVLSSSLSNARSASHVPSYKTYPRPEAPVAALTLPVQDQRFNNSYMFQTSNLKRTILKWEHSMFGNYKLWGAPEDLCSFPLKRVPVTFSSYQEYFDVLYPLLLINTFEEMANEWLNGRKITIDLRLGEIDYISGIARASFTACLNPEQETMQRFPKEDDLVFLSLPNNTGAYLSDEPHSPEMSFHFGWVTRSNVLNNGGGKMSTLVLTIETRGNVTSVNTQLVRCEVIGSLVSTLREFKALCRLESSKMLHPVLKPDIRFFAPCQDDMLNLDMPEYNRDQAKAISCGVAVVKRTEKTPKILLINGPPGTGKSKVIVGILDRLLSYDESPSGNPCTKHRRRRILVCAQSNAAVDSLMKKIVNAFKMKCVDIRAARGNCGDINLVRLGSDRVIADKLKPYSLDNRVKKEMEKVKQKVGYDPNVQRKKEELDKRIDALSKDCAKINKKSPKFEELNNKKLSCLAEREKLSRILKEFQSKKQEIRSWVLREAHVICSTLSTSGSPLLEFAFRRLGHEPFGCVIVDEAGQAKETEILIPLLYQCQNLILVGDPKQLPPTVLSQRAKELGYDKSLMSRVLDSLHSQNTRLSPSLFLSFQYRMHPDICAFPSKYIYDNDLKNDPETAKRLCYSTFWPLEPYRVFDVTDGKESREGDSFSNQKEAKLVVLLFKLLVEKHAREKQPIRVGIITPYKAQKHCIQQALHKEAGKEFSQSINVDTVDGFQGGEMDCIIVSCVRASNENGSIGFLGNCQRLNVTITRAKYSLFILGHLRTLKEHSDWGELIKDADKRGTIIKASESNFHKVTSMVLKPNVRASNYSLSHTSGSAHSDRQGDQRTHFRPADPHRLEAHHANREQARDNHGFVYQRQPSSGTSDPRLHPGHASSSRLPSEPRRNRRVSFSSATSG